MRLAAAVAAVLLALAAGARATEIPCAPVEPDVIRADGLLDDWAGVAGAELGAGSDFALTVKCNYDRDTLYLLADVRDDYLARTRAAHAAEDHVEFGFADGDKVERLIVYPADGAVPHRVRWASGHKLVGVEEADALQPRGWAVELRIALASVPGWSAGAPSLRLAAAAFDCDSKANPSVESALATAPLPWTDPARLGAIEFAEARAALDGFLRDRHLSMRDVRFDRIGRVLPQGNARVIVGGRTLAVISDEYAYLELPVASAADVLEVRLVDLAGDGHDAILVRYREGGPSGAREVLAAYRMAGEGLRRTFGVEVAKSQGPNRLSTKINFVKRKSATDIVVEAQPAVGWTEATYRDAPDGELAPIPLPWTKERRVRFGFRGDEYYRVE